jgi:hypothetical protein
MDDPVMRRQRERQAETESQQGHRQIDAKLISRTLVHGSLFDGGRVGGAMT